MAESEEHPGAHVIARRMALAAACGGATMAGCALGLLVITDDRVLRGGRALAVAAMIASASAAWCALLTLAEAAALRVRPVARVPVLGLLGSGAAALLAAVLVWVTGLVTGADLTRTMKLAERLIGDALGAPAAAIGVSAGVLAPFVAIGAARALPLFGARPWPLQLEVVLAAGAGLVAAWLLLHAFWQRPPSSFVPYASLAALSVAASLGLRLADRLEAAVRYRLARSRSEEEV